MMMTTFTGEISIWTWAVIFGYIFADTNLTIIIRLILKKKMVSTT